MGKLILEIQTSIDGFIATKNGSTNWMRWNFGPEWTWDKALQQYHTDLNLSADCIFISRQMAEEGFIAHWKSVAEKSNDPQSKFARHVVTIPKIVFSTTLDKTVPIPGGWDNAEIAEGNFVKAIEKLKKKYNTILVYGGASFVSSLIKAGLIDELHLIVNPVSLGSGLPIFKAAGKQTMDLIKARQFGNGMVVLHYKLKQEE